MRTTKGSNPTLSINKIAMAVGVGIVVIVGSVLAFSRSTEMRSKAAEEQSIFKQWEFNGTSAEGWLTNEPHSLAVRAGRLFLQMANSERIPHIRNQRVQTDLPAGNKYLVFSASVGRPSRLTPTPTKCPLPPTCAGSQRMIVGDPRGGNGCPMYKCVSIVEPRVTGPYVQGVADEPVDDERMMQDAMQKGTICPQDVRRCPNGSYVSRSGRNCSFAPCQPTGVRRFNGKIFYTLKKTDNNPAELQKPISFSGIVNGIQSEIKVQFPEIGAARIRTLRITFDTGVSPEDPISIDWIRILGAKPLRNTPTPTVSPYISSTQYPCAGPDGSTCTMGSCPRIRCFREPCDQPVCRLQTGVCRQGICRPEVSTTPVVGTREACRYAKDGTACTDTCASACPPGKPCTKQCVTRSGYCKAGVCDTWGEQSATVPYTGPGCARLGCSGELCLEEGSKLGMSACVYKSQYACYKSARCERQKNGSCGWTESSELTSCLNSRQRSPNTGCVTECVNDRCFENCNPGV